MSQVQTATPRENANDIVARHQWQTFFFIRRWSEHTQLSASIIERLYQLKEAEGTNIASQVAVKAKSTTGLFESNFDLFQDRHAGLQQLKSFVVETIQSVVSKLNHDEVPPANIDVAIHDAWFHITNDGGFHDAHVHHDCSWCGIYYLQLGDAGQTTSSGAPNGANRFYSPFLTGGQYSDYGNRYLGGSYIDPPIEEGMLLLFPSFLVHSALPYSGDKDRIVIAFNSQSRVGAGS